MTFLQKTIGSATQPTAPLTHPAVPLPRPYIICNRRLDTTVPAMEIAYFFYFTVPMLISTSATLMSLTPLGYRHP